MPDSRRSQRRRVVSELRAQGRYGPELRDVLPVFAGLGLSVLGAVLGFVWLYRTHGVAWFALALVVAAVGGSAGLRLRRGVVRRRGGRYTAAELADLDDQGLMVAATRMLRRDGYQVVDLTARKGRPRLYAHDAQGRELDVAFRPVSTPGGDETISGPAPLRETGRPGTGHPTSIVVHRGDFSRADVLWASRQDGVHLLDGHRLQRWAAGRSLDELGLAPQVR